MLKTFFDLRKTSHIGIVMIGVMSLFLLYVALTSEDLFVQIGVGIFGAPMFIMSILTAIKQKSDFLIIKSGYINSKNNLIKTSLSPNQIHEIKLKQTSEIFSRRNAKPHTVWVVELIALTSEGDIRIFDFSADIRFRDELNQLGKYILIETKKKTTHSIN